MTRQSILDLARGWSDLDVVERKFSIGELTAAADEGRLLEAFGAGTAAVVSPIKGIGYGGRDYAIPLDPADPSAGAGPIARRVWTELLAIQYGHRDGPNGEPHPWAPAV